MNHPAADPLAGASVRPERILRTRRLRDEVLIEMAHQVAADPHATPPVSWRLDDGVLVASDPAGERVWVTAIEPAAVTITRSRVAVGDVEVAEWLADLDELRRRAQKITEEIGLTTLELIATLRRQAGLPTRDTGSVLGLTGSRISQLEQAQADNRTE